MNIVSLAVRTHILIDSPVEDVWQAILDFPKRAPTVNQVELLSGEWDKQGRVLLITKKEEVGMDPFILEAIVMEPCKWLVHKIDTKEKEKPGEKDMVSAYNDFTLSVEASGETNVVFSRYQSYNADALPLTTQEESIKSMQENYLKPLKLGLEEGL